VPADQKDDALELEARRIYLRYAVEVIEALGLCPWARAAREAGRVATRVIRGGTLAVGDVLPHILAADGDEEHDVTLVLLPECTLDSASFARFTASLREHYDASVGRAEAALAIADFHPGARTDESSPERLVPFVRKSPDPTLQLIRHAALQSVQRDGATDGTRFFDEQALRALGEHAFEPSESVSQRIARANARTLERVGIAHVQAQLDDIARDRLRAYAAAGALVR
jgi:hypothetical protein